MIKVDITEYTNNEIADAIRITMGCHVIARLFDNEVYFGYYTALLSDFAEAASALAAIRLAEAWVDETKRRAEIARWN